MRFHSSCLFHTGQSLLVDFGLCTSIRLVFFDTGQSLLVDFGMCSPTRLVFLTLVSCCWWTLTCALPLVLSFSHWSVAVGGLWLASCLFHTGQSLLVDFGLCASTRLAFFTLVCRCWWTLACALPLILSFFDTGQSLLVDIGLCASTRLVFFDIGQSLLVEFGLCAPTSLVFLIVVSYCWWTLTCALLLVLSF